MLFILIIQLSIIGCSKKTGCISGDCKNGYGTYVWEDEEGYYKYEGEWLNGRPHGRGIKEDVDGNSTFKFDGEWKNGVFSGYGTMLIMIKDSGRLMYKESYVGEWLNGKEHGQGTKIKYGEKYEGLWVNGKFIEKK